MLFGSLPTELHFVLSLFLYTLFCLVIIGGVNLHTHPHAFLSIKDRQIDWITKANSDVGCKIAKYNRPQYFQKQGKNKFIFKRHYRPSYANAKKKDALIIMKLSIACWLSRQWLNKLSFIKLFQLLHSPINFTARKRVECSGPAWSIFCSPTEPHATSAYLHDMYLTYIHKYTFLFIALQFVFSNFC